METALQKLAKVLDLERRGGYKNRAVIGGVQRYIPVWIEEARAQAATEMEKVLIEQVGDLLMDYGGLAGPPARAKLLVPIRERLDKTITAKQPAQKPAPARPRSRRRPVREPEPPPPQIVRRPAVAPKPTLSPPEAPLPPEVKKPKPRKVKAEAPKPVPPPQPEVSKPEPQEIKAEAPKPAPPPRPEVKKSEPRKIKPPAKAKSEPAGLDAPITAVRGIGPRTAEQMQKLGIITIRDMLTFYPRRYVDYGTLKSINRLVYGEQVTILGTIWETSVRGSRGRQKLVRSIIGDGTGTIQCTWFNQPWLADKLRTGVAVMLSGKVDMYLGRLVFTSPEWELVEKEQLHTGRIVPVYPLTAGLNAKAMRKHVKRAVDYWARRTPDSLPDEVRVRQGLMKLETALLQIHFPDNLDRLKAARCRLVFDELLVLQLGMLRLRRRWRSQPGIPLQVPDGWLETFIGRLSFQLTAAQQRSLTAILGDMAGKVPMNRLLQGDVGSGKTVVAAAAIAAAVQAGAQAALMAPTEILAEQHVNSLRQLLGDARLGLLTGRLPAAEKKAIYDELAAGAVDVVVGTHALIQAGVAFKKLGLAIVDEQHRFGVEQRAALRQKGHNPHVVVMTATPIPRTLALTLYGDLDISVIDELPPGRQVVETRWLQSAARERAYSFIHTQIESGRQAFVICPLVEASNTSEAKAATEEYRRLQESVFPRLKLGLLHGRMKGEEKEAAMTAFYQGETDILVSTSVVEVGIDVPNASTMLVEGANRFGLAQLHQFRGRVGRGEHKSYCLLLADNTTPDAEERLAALEATNDGFVLAEKDLELRGPGEFFGTRQSGLPDLKLASLSDVGLLEQARNEAQVLFDLDPPLELPEHRLLARQVDRFWAGRGDVS